MSTTGHNNNWKQFFGSTVGDNEGNTNMCNFSKCVSNTLTDLAARLRDLTEDKDKYTFLWQDQQEDFHVTQLYQFWWNQVLQD